MRNIGLIAAIALALVGCVSRAPDLGANQAADWTPEPYVQTPHPEWARNAVIYQINTRQFTHDGTIRAAREHLARLDEMGVDILWLMPIHPIGEEKRKGTLGSPYAVKDYRAVNPELGTIEDLRHFVHEAHERGMYVILDWVANHSAWDNPMITDHPEWYTLGPDGKPQHPPGTDWTDVADLNFDDPALRQYMAESMLFWVEEVGVDGFRADVAGFVPLDFWEDTRALLETVKPVFMLAEWETRDVHQRAFSASYAWDWKNAMQAAVREQSTDAVRGVMANKQNTWPRDAYRMHYTANHDQNTWDGTASQIYGDGLEMAIVFSFTAESIPLIYNGQEAGLDHRLAFFEKDEIVWRDHPHADLFTTLIDLKTDTRALRNGTDGAPAVMIENSNPDAVLSFTRQSADDGVVVVLNFTNQPQRIELTGAAFANARGSYRDLITGQSHDLGATLELDMPAWGYVVYVR